MWEAIRANRRRSTWLMLAMGAVLMALGASVGILAVSWRGQPTIDDQLLGALFGVLLGIATWAGSWIYSSVGGESAILRSVNARQIEQKDHPRLWNVVEEMSIAAGLSPMPRVYIVDDSAPNAFAVGRGPGNSSVAFTSTLLRTLTRDELQGVAAHEIGHIVNEDIRFMTQAAVLVGGVELLSRFFIRVGPLSGGSRRMSAGGRGSGGNKGGGGSGVAVLVAVAFVVAILSPIVIRLLYYACSRTREYLADASAAQFTRYPEGLASALEKIVAHQMTSMVGEVNGAVAPLYIVNPLEATKLAAYSATHPPTESRVQILRAMGGGASFVDYEAAVKKVEGDRLNLPALELAARTGEKIKAREADPNQDPFEAVKRAHAAIDLVDSLAGFTPILCLCGLRVKTPPESTASDVDCPRCGRHLEVPNAENEGAEPRQELPTVAETGGTLRYARASSEWEAFSCNCGQTIQLGPGYPLDYTICAKCDRRIEIEPSRSNSPELN